MLAVHVCWGILLIVSANEGRNCYSHAQTPFASTSNFAGRVGSVSTTGYERYISRVGALAVALGVGATGLGLAPTANATCASIFGIGNSADCTSTLFECRPRYRRRSGGPRRRVVRRGFRRRYKLHRHHKLGVYLQLGHQPLWRQQHRHGRRRLWNRATNIGGNNNTVTTQGSSFNLARNILGSDNTVTTTGGSRNAARNLLGDGNTVTQEGGTGNFARNSSRQHQHRHDNGRHRKHSPKPLRQQQHRHDKGRLRELCSKSVRRHKHRHDTGRLFKLGHQSPRQQQHHHVDRRVLQRGEEHWRQTAITCPSAAPAAT